MDGPVAVSQYQTPEVPLSSIPTSLPLNPIPEHTDHEAVAAQAIQQLAQSGPQQSTDDAHWRDVVALTGNIRTFLGGLKIRKTWTKLAAINQPTQFQLIPGSSSIVRYGPVGWVEACFTFNLPPRDQLPQRLCSGIIRLAPDTNNEWRICVLVTMLEQIERYGNVDKLDRISPEESNKQRAENGIHSGKEHFDCIIVGGGQAGLATAGRLKALGISHVVLDRNAAIGGNWLTRYKSFTLHTSKYHSEMPLGGVFSEEDPYFLRSADLAAGFERFVQWYGLNVWLSMVVKKAAWSDKDQEWALDVEHQYTDVNGTPTINGGPDIRRLKARHLVFAMGSGGQTPKVPTIANRQAYKGEVLHSVEYSAAEKWKGKRGIVVGSANSAHDVATDMANAGLNSVTVLQRSPTTILPLSTYQAIFDPIYNEKSDIGLADKLSLTIPLSITRAGAIPAINQLADAMPDYWDTLNRVGFAVDRYPDLIHILYERQGGHYYDVGESKKIVDGQVSVKLGTIDRFTEDGLLLQDGRALDADVVVLATGFEGNMRHAAYDIVGPEMASRMEEYMMVDREGELRGYAKPMAGQRNLWYIGSYIAMSRYYSRYLALQIKAELEGAAFEPYRED